MATESIYTKKERVRPPRVMITSEVQVGDAKVQKELPFVAGVLADLSGMPEQPLEKLGRRGMEDISRDNFDNVMKRIGPRLAYGVENRLRNDGSQMRVELHFEKLEDFEPEKVADQVEPLRELVKARAQLQDLLGRAQGNSRLEEHLELILRVPELRKKLQERLAADAGAGEGK